MLPRNTRLRTPDAVKFDANNQTHRQAYLTFLQTKKWPIKFDLEWPFTSIPAMVLFYLAAKACENDGELDLQTVLENSAPADAKVSEGATLVVKEPVPEVA